MTDHYQPDLFDEEWDRMSHTPTEYQREIRQLRERCWKYWKELEELRAMVGNLRADLETVSSEVMHFRTMGDGQ